MKMFSLISIVCLLPCLPSLPTTSKITQTATGGSEVVLPCGLQDTSSTSCHWVKDGWMVEVGERFSLRSCDLVISPVLEGDEAEYRCQLGGAQPRLAAPVSLKVSLEPGLPHIQEGEDGLSLESGDIAQLTCQSSGGRPAAELEWWDDTTGERIRSEVTQHVERDGRTFRTSSTLRTPVNKYSQIYCTAHSEAFPAMKKSSLVEINIRGEPRLEQVQLRTGESVKIFCHNNIRDSNVQFRWFINDKRIHDETSDVLQINEFSDAYDKSVVKCAAGNDEIIRAVQLTLNQQQKPESTIVTFDQVMKQSQNEVMLSDEESDDEAEEDEVRKYSKSKTTFICVVEDTEDVSREPKYVWVNGKLVTNSKATDENNKSYKCKVVKNGSRKIKKMSKELKSVSKTLRKMSKTLNEFSK